jgi:rare lipoprotein A (peptidoglycan hydrolase)
MIGLEYNPIIVKKPSWLAIKYNSESKAKKSLYYWDSNKNSWIELPSYADSNCGYVKAITHLPYSKIVVLEDIVPKEEYSGLASWYYNGGEMTAAMNQFEIGDEVKVINKVNGKSCTVKIIDRGPFISGRVIDLSDSAFAAIASLGEGIIDVKVESL